MQLSTHMSDIDGEKGWQIANIQYIKKKRKCNKHIENSSLEHVLPLGDLIIYGHHDSTFSPRTSGVVCTLPSMVGKTSLGVLESPLLLKQTAPPLLLEANPSLKYGVMGLSHLQRLSHA